MIPSFCFHFFLFTFIYLIHLSYLIATNTKHTIPLTQNIQEKQYLSFIDEALTKYYKENTTLLLNEIESTSRKATDKFLKKYQHPKENKLSDSQAMVYLRINKQLGYLEQYLRTKVDQKHLDSEERFATNENLFENLNVIISFPNIHFNEEDKNKLNNILYPKNGEIPIFTQLFNVEKKLIMEIDYKINQNLDRIVWEPIYGANRDQTIKDVLEFIFGYEPYPRFFTINDWELISSISKEALKLSTYVNYMDEVRQYVLKMECSICLENIGFDDKNFKCGHVYHEKCIKKWRNAQTSCPNCRSVLKSIQKLPHM